MLMQALRGLFLCTLAGALIYFVVKTVHWPMLVNAPVMHYVNFMMGQGLRPYSDITDMNMPGAYLLEHIGMSLFGGGDLGWRVYDYFLAAATIGCMVVIAKPYDWLAGVYAGGIFALRHGSEGAWFSGEREQEMMVLLAGACALLFVSVRRKKPVVTFGFGLLAGLAASIKPTLAPFGLLSLLILYLALRRQGVASRGYLLWGLSGLAAPLLWALLFLAHFHAFQAFFFVLHAVTPVYAVLNNATWQFLIRHLFPDEWIALIPLAAAGLILRRQWNWEKSVLLLATGCGLLSYFVQHKGFFYQRYTFLAFALLMASIEMLAPARSLALRVVACAALLFASLYLLPRYVRSLRYLPTFSALTASLENDLQRADERTLQGKVQCFDVTFGCLNALYHLRLQENTGFTGDLLLFPQKPNAATTYYRDLFWKLQAQNPADLLVLTNQEFGARNTYNRLMRWPEFSSYLSQNYQLATERRFPYEDRFVGQPAWPDEIAPGYRIYVRKRVPSLSPP